MMRAEGKGKVDHYKFGSKAASFLDSAAPDEGFGISAGASDVLLPLYIVQSFKFRYDGLGGEQIPRLQREVD